VALLSIEDLSVEYRTERGPLRAVDRVSLEMGDGETLGLAGESGCGKSTLAFSILRLLPRSARVSGRILLDGADVLGMDDRALRGYRWKSVALVPQGSMNAFDPVRTIGSQIVEGIRTHEPVSTEQAWGRTRALLSSVGIPESRARNFPHQFSGGMRQRAAIAMALSLNPKLVILDEPTTALDVVVQKQILRLLRRLQREYHTSFIFITHDLSVLAEIATSIAVMYAGRIAEIGPADGVLSSPQHPYSKALIGAIPRIDGERSTARSIPGLPPDLISPPAGCRFHPRCPLAFKKCSEVEPALVPISEDTSAACHLLEEWRRG
jgi:oligopeptide/dipeptide ABC transporter ATP-binding protein